METYIIRIYRRHEKGESPVSTGIVENAANGRKRKFADPGELLKILKLGKPRLKGGDGSRARP